ncbi:MULTISPECIES: GMC family oxidoreductase [unclassified Mycobacterium]|uniref:GMC family oxidoreductase n=1 Tax=unclassified Mycobacterium TaxID=2642494 RepID=UPI0009ED4A89|nr:MULTISPECIES: GMC family oxidoreductase [unclassified Mycobacterium]
MTKSLRHRAFDDPEAVAHGDVRRLAHSTLAPEYDFIVCGSGSSGSVVARRIAENPDMSVLLLEAGTHDATPSVMVPALWPTNLGSERDWGHRSEPNPHINNRALPMSMGKVLGGGSSINVMAWSRGHRADWDFFAAEAKDPAWSYSAVVDIYRRIEDWLGAPDPRYRGSGGPVGVQPATSPDGLGPTTLEAARAMGLPTFAHPNGRMMEYDRGAALCDVIIVDGRRQSIFRSYVYPILSNPNLTVLTETSVTRLSIEGNRVTGVEVRRDGKLQHVAARGEVVLSLGAINTPKVLMQSGIGDAAEMREFGIEVRQHLPGVGKNLQDHACLPVNYEFAQPFESTNQGEAQLFWTSDPDLDAPDLFCCQAAVPLASPENIARFGELPASCWTLCGSLTHPSSRGFIRLSGPGPEDPVRVHLNSLSHPDDFELAVSCVEFLRDLGNSSALRPFIKNEVLPGNLKGDDLRSFVRDGVVPYWHTSGTAKLGEDPLSVVDSDLRVHGLESLRVADASVMPRVTSGNTMAPCVVIGERAAECIRERHHL